ncbi:MAG: OmpA family protein [Bacteroidales bacterium]|nr:OmpA family protein [Bacteroidales bacterium]
MKKIFILFGVLALAIGANAQSYQHSNYIGLNINGGFNTMTYNPATGDASLGLGFGAGLRYTHFFGTHFGIGFGAQFNHAQASALYDFTEVTTGLTHDDNGNLTYDLNTVYDGWRERQTINYLSVPVELYWRAPVSERAFVLIGLGAQFDMPLNAKYTANEGSYKNTGNFYVNGAPLSYSVEDLPNHGFQTYDADFESDVTINKKGISVIADLGFNYALSKNWGLYFGIYGGYGITNLLDSVSSDPMLKINEEDASKLDYNGTFASNQIDALHLLNFGAKLGINIGWDCEKKDGSKGNKDNDDAELTAYDDNNNAADNKQGKDNKDGKDNAANSDNNNNAGNNNGNAADNNDKAGNNNDNAGNNNAGNNNGNAAGNNNYGNDNYGNQAYGNDGADETPEEAAAREARCNARRMNNPDMAQALNSIDADLDEAEQMANATGDEKAKAAVEDARAKAADAKAAYKNGKYCRAYDLLNEAYGAIADSYANDADAYAGKSGNDDAKKAAEDAALYAEAAHKDGLDCAMAAGRNARINAEIARDQENGGKKANAWNDPNYADYLANEALAMGEDANCKPAQTSAKDASGKAYRGNLADSYAASAKSFSESANKYASRTDNPEAKEAAAEATRYAAEAAEAARMGDTAAAYRAARAAQQAAERARRLANGENGDAADNNGGNNNANKDNSANKEPNAQKPADRAQLQQYLDQINATVHFDFSSTEPKFDSKTDLAIRALCAAMRADKNVKILITGHTDNIGSAESNMNYGQRRAEALKQLMVNQGAPAAQISTASKGQNEPVVDNDTDEHRYQNRRAVITLK